MTPAPRPAQTGRERDLVAACCQRAEDMGANLEVVGQRNAKGSGTTLGAPDLILFASGWTIPIETKRLGRIPSDDGQLSLDQRARIYDRLQQGVQTAVGRSRAIDARDALQPRGHRPVAYDSRSVGGQHAH